MDNNVKIVDDVGVANRITLNTAESPTSTIRSIEISHLSSLFRLRLSEKGLKLWQPPLIHSWSSSAAAEIP